VGDVPLEIILISILVLVALSAANGRATALDRWIGGNISSGSMNSAPILGPPSRWSSSPRCGHSRLEPDADEG
jgi:hypothetical protein